VARDSEWDNRGMVWIELQGAVNVRDVGGLPTVDGGETVYRRLLRSENLQELTERDIALLVDEIGVTTVVDLRSTRELMTEGPAPLDAVDGVQHAHHPVLKEFLDASDTVAAALLLTAQQEDADRYPDDLMCGHYLGYLENRPEEVVGALRSIVTAPGAAIVHCAAGKDRTGVVTALALSVAGTRPDAITADYAASADRIDAILARLRATKAYSDAIDGQPTGEQTPRPETMDAFLEQVETRHGGAAQWLAGHGFGADEAAALRARLRAA
jgi:protein-tyrosine phosphatase